MIPHLRTLLDCGVRRKAPHTLHNTVVKVDQVPCRTCEAIEVNDGASTRRVLVGVISPGGPGRGVRALRSPHTAQLLLPCLVPLNSVICLPLSACCANPPHRAALHGATHSLQLVVCLCAAFKHLRIVRLELHTSLGAVPASSTTACLRCRPLEARASTRRTRRWRPTSTSVRPRVRLIGMHDLRTEHPPHHSSFQ